MKETTNPCLNVSLINKYIRELTWNGYTIIPQAIAVRDVKWLLDDVKYIYERDKDKISKDTPYLNINQPNVYNLQNKEYSFINTLLDLKDLEEILKKFLNDKWYKQIPQDQPNYILRSYGARSSNDALPLHIDSFIPYVGDEVAAMQVAIILEDQTIENGCTVVVPGTHDSGRYAEKEYYDHAVPLTPKAGDIVIWDSRLWHGTTKNTTTGTRWAIIATFSRWWIKQQFDIPNALPNHIKSRCNGKEKYILGFGSVPYVNEYEGIESKKGYEEL
jgi:hypothetical protein